MNYITGCQMRKCSELHSALTCSSMGWDLLWAGAGLPGGRIVLVAGPGPAKSRCCRWVIRADCCCQPFTCVCEKGSDANVADGGGVDLGGPTRFDPDLEDWLQQLSLPAWGKSLYQATMAVPRMEGSLISIIITSQYSKCPILNKTYKEMEKYGPLIGKKRDWQKLSLRKPNTLKTKTLTLLNMLFERNHWLKKKQN